MSTDKPYRVAVIGLGSMGMGAAIAHNLFVNASNAGYGKSDDSAVIRNYSGIKLPGDPA